jgi:hypothetical protein
LSLFFVICCDFAGLILICPLGFDVVPPLELASFLSRRAVASVGFGGGVLVMTAVFEAAPAVVGDDRSANPGRKDD